MAMYSLKLHFLGADTSKGYVPGAIAYVGLENWKQDESGNILISHECVGPSEWEAEINRLKAELDELLLKGKRAFKEYHDTLRRRT